MMARSRGGGEPCPLLPLSRSQENIWNLETAHPGLPINNICSVLDIGGRLDIPLLQSAVQMLKQTTPQMHTRVMLKDGVPLQCLVPDEQERIPYFDFSLTGSEGIDEWSLSIAREPMPLDAPLCYCAVFKRANGTGGVLIKTHHLISDAWSQGLMLNRLAEIYLNLLSGQEPDLTPSPPYEAHILAEQAYLNSQQHARDLAYWARTLVDLPGAHAKEHEYATISPIGRRMSFPLSERLNRLVASFCDQKKVSPFALFYLALAVYLKRVRGQERFCIGVPVINRRTYEEKKTVGMFVSTLPFVNSLDEGMSFSECNEKLKADWYELLRHQQLPYAEIRAIALENGYTSGKLFDIALSFQNGRMLDNGDSSISFEGRWQYSGYQAEALCVHISSRSGDGSFLVDYDYLTQLFSAGEIDVLHAYLVNLLTDALQNPDKPVRLLRILGEAEEERVLYTFNATTAPLPRESLIEALRRQATDYASRVAVIAGGERITYEVLWARAKARAEALRNLLPGAGCIVAIRLPRGIELFTAIWAVIESGNAWLLIDDDQPTARVNALLRQCGASALLHEDGVTLLDVSGEFTKPPADDPIAYIVCTSGSTGEPKAVQVGQRSLQNFARAMAPIYGRGGVLSTCNVGFDAFVLESSAALLNARTIILANEAERNDPVALSRLIRSYAVGFFAMTPSRLSAYIKEPSFAGAIERLESIVCGGESFPLDLLQKLPMLCDANIYNQYGPSEATVAVTSLKLNDAPHITIGKPLRNCRVYVLDANLRPQPLGTIGEIFVGGACLAHGYRGDAALTAARFLPDPFGEGRIYRTGDLGWWNERGEIVYVGRADNQLKLHGYRIEPAEIEARLLMHPLVTGAAVTVADGRKGSRMLSAYYTAREPLSGSDLLSFASAYLPRYMLPAYTAQLDALPLTRSGKIDYHALPAPVLEFGEEQPRDSAEALLLEIWRNVLNNRNVDVNADYFLSGGDSLNAIEMLLAVEKTFGVTPGVTDLYANSTVRRFAPLLKAADEPRQPALTEIPTAPDSECYPLTPTQQRFFVLHRLDETGIAYNMPGAFRLSAPPDEARLARAFRRLIELDEQFRTGFAMRDTAVVSKIEPSVPFEIEAIEADTIEAAFRGFVRPFDLSRPPLFRAALWTDAAGVRTLLFDMHHIISDGISGALLFERLDQLYRGETPDMPRVRYRDYACWLAGREDAALDPQRAYWQKQLEGAPPSTDLPADRPKATVFDGRGAKVRFSISPEITAMCDRFCETNRMTPYVLFVSVFGALLARWSGQSDIVVGSPVSGRRHPDLARVTGDFINTMPLRLHVADDEPLSSYLARVRETAAEMLDNQDLRFDEIVRLAGVSREAGGNPLYNVLFSLVPVKPSGFCFGSVQLKMLPLDCGIAKLDLSLEGTRTDTGYDFVFEYAVSQFHEATVQIWARAFEAAVRTAVTEADPAVCDLPAVSAGDRLRLIDRPNRLRAPFDAAPVDRQLLEIAEITPDAIALEWGDKERYTYAELIQRACGLAKRLVAGGVKPGDRIGLFTRRDGDMIVAMLGIWLAGGAYVPLDPAYPKAKMQYMLETAGASLLVCGAGVAPPEDMPCQTVEAAFGGGFGFVPPERDEHSTAYVLFTSGSTGQPKGVMVGHRALSNLLIEGERLLGDCPRVLCATSVIFDIFVTDVWLPLALGKTVVIADEEELLLPWKLAERITRGRVNAVQLTPSRMLMCIGNEAFYASLARVRALLLIGEPLTLPLRDALREACPNGRVVNQYGPTEATVFCSFADVTRDEVIHIGKPNANCRFYAMLPNGRMAPPTARGELYIAGECLADGYIGRDDLTAAAFVPDPFAPGEKMYKTGDVVRLRPDGNWDFLGRNDRQIKLNGHRIEIEGIAAQILRSGLARESAVVAVEKDGAVHSLRAFLVPTEGYAAEKLDAYLAANLPDYMLPSETICLEAFPRTDNGKTNLRALMAIDPAEYRQMQKPAAKAQTVNPLHAIWCEVLKTDAVDDSVSFFKQGGSSLTALMALNRYYQHGYTMSMNDFYRHPTLREQSALLGTGQSAAEAPAPVAALPRHVPARAHGCAKDGESFVTGATGYFGAHLVEALLARGEKVTCLVRDEARFQEIYRAYFGRMPEGVRAVVGDIEKPRFGLAFADYAEIARRAARIWHSAADVRHYAPEADMMRTNVTGTETVLAFAQDAGAWLGHVSTASVAGTRVEGRTGPVAFTETDLDIGQNWRENPYVRSKALAEARVVAAMEKGLPAQILRVGRLSARARDGVFQLNAASNAMFRVISGLCELGAAPESWATLPFEMTPVDQCARAALAGSQTGAGALHLCQPNPVQPAALLREITGVALLPDEAFRALLQARLSRDTSSYLTALAEMFFAETAAERQVTLDTARTVSLLAEAGFIWPSQEPKSLARCFAQPGRRD